MDLKYIPTKELEAELAKREDRKREYCKCGKYLTYMGCSRSWREERHCEGCRRPVENCTC